MKNLSFLKPVFTWAFLLMFTLILIVNLLIFGYLFKDAGIIYWIIVQQVAVFITYMWARNLKTPDALLWFAKKWWPEEVTPIKQPPKK